MELIDCCLRKLIDLESSDVRDGYLGAYADLLIQGHLSGLAPKNAASNRIALANAFREKMSGTQRSLLILHNLTGR